MTSVIDNFDTDPLGGTPRWVEEEGTLGWDSGTLDCAMAVGTAVSSLRFDTTLHATDIDHECQGTLIVSNNDFSGANGCRLSSGNTDFYSHEPEPGGGAAGNIFLVGWKATSFDTIATYTDQDIDNNDWITTRLAASGGVGNNVVLDSWYERSSTGGKPSDPGWLGDDASPQQTVTDTDANRLDDAADTYAGMCGESIATFDNQADFWKARLIADRGVEIFHFGNRLTLQAVHRLGHY